MTRKNHFDVLVIGSASVDVVFSGMPHWPVPGQEIYVRDFAIGAGAIFNTAATLSRLGMRVGLACELGKDFLSRFILEEIDKAGICRDLVVVRDYPLRAISVCLAHDGERGFVSYADGHAVAMMSAVEPLPSPPARHLLHDIGHLLAGCDFDAVFMYAFPAMLGWLDVVAHEGVPMFLDTGWHADSLVDERTTAVVRRGTFFMPNALEAMQMTRAENAEEAVCVLAQLLPTAIVKLGERGVVACQGGELVYCPAYPVERVVDTTGAGDAFNGGFIYGVLKGYRLVDALRCGTICGSLSTTALTGTVAVPTAEELEGMRLSWPVA